MRAHYRGLVLLGAIAVVAFVPSRAFAHRLRVFAAADGSAISGSAYLSGGGAPRNAVVRVTGPNGEALGQTVTDDRGRFSFTPSRRCHHTFTIDTGDGHAATFTVPADALPAALPPLAPSSGPTTTTRPAASAAPRAADSPPSPSSDAADAHAISHELRALREQIDRLESSIRLHDVLGGIGYILGLTGLSFYFLAARKTRANNPPRPPSRTQTP